MPDEREGRRAPQADRERASDEGLDPDLLDAVFESALERGGVLALEIDAWRRGKRSLADALARALLTALDQTTAERPGADEARHGDSGSVLRPSAVIRSSKDPRRLLSPREREVVAGLERGQRVGAIADRLGLSHHTVRNHLKSVFHKLRVTSQVELLAKLRGESGSLD